MTFVMAEDPTKRAAKRYNKINNNKVNNNNRKQHNNKRHRTCPQSGRLQEQPLQVISRTTESLEPLSQPSKPLRSWIGFSMARDAMRFGCWGSSKWRVLTDLPPRWGSWENLELGAPKPDAYRTSTAVEDLDAYGKRQNVPTKEGESIGVSSHLRAPTSPTHTRPDRRKKKWNGKRERRWVVEATRGSPIWVLKEEWKEK